MKALYMTAYGDPTVENERKGIYVVGTLPRPTRMMPDEFVIRVHASSVNPIDWLGASGKLKMLMPRKFPWILGYDVSGVVETVGTGVTKFKVGDEVIGLPSAANLGAFAEYAVLDESRAVHKPRNLTHAQAACIPMVGLTALQQFRSAALESRQPPRTVFVQAPLGGVGSMSMALAKHHFKLERIIVAASERKLARAHELFGGGGVEFVDYGKEDVAKKYKGQVDVVFHSAGSFVTLLPMLKAGTTPRPKIVSVSTTPAGDDVDFGHPVPWVVRRAMDLMDWNTRRKARRWGGDYNFVFMKENAADLKVLCDLAEAGHLQPIVGKVFPLEQGREAMEVAKSGTVDGKVVIQIVPDSPSHS